MDKVTRQCPQTTTFLKRKESRSGIEAVSNRGPSAYQPNALPLGQTGSPAGLLSATHFCRAACCLQKQSLTAAHRKWTLNATLLSFLYLPVIPCTSHQRLQIPVFIVFDLTKWSVRWNGCWRCFMSLLNCWTFEVATVLALDSFLVHTATLPQISSHSLSPSAPTPTPPPATRATAPHTLPAPRPQLFNSLGNWLQYRRRKKIPNTCGRSRLKSLSHHNLHCDFSIDLSRKV